MIKKDIPPTRLAENFVLRQFAERQEKDGEVYYYNIYSHPMLVKMCGVEPGDIVQISFKERTDDDPESSYWGWEDFKDSPPDHEYCMIYGNRILFDMCFIYGVDIEVEKGNGRPVNLIITEVLPYTN